jgi:hypothetical protein
MAPTEAAPTRTVLVSNTITPYVQGDVPVGIRRLFLAAGTGGPFVETRVVFKRA